MKRREFLFAALFAGGILCGPAQGESEIPRQMRGVGIAERLGERVATSTPLVNSKGEPATLGGILADGKPMILTLNYFRCTNLCNIQLHGLTEGLRALGETPGEDFHLVTVSIDPTDTPDKAAAKEENYSEATGHPRARWTFLTGTQEAVQAVADSVGFQFKFDADTNQFAHTAAIFLVSPQGVNTRILYGIDYPAGTLKMSLLEASAGTLGTPLERILFTCFHYDGDLGRYALAAMGVMRMGGILLLVSMAICWVFLVRRRTTSEVRRA